jgi:predicted RNase H-like HicB family nuclease
MLRCYSQASDLAILEGNMNEAITVYLKATLLEAPLLSFTGT